jgi:hypothetical protein
MALTALWDSVEQEQKTAKFDWHQYLLDAVKNGRCKKSYIQNGNELVVVF